MPKLIVQIPCFNEAATLPATVADIPREIPGIDRVEVLVIDDGSSDGTSEAAFQCGVDHVVRHRRNRGLASAFRTGVQNSLRLGADIIVNTDADNQYDGRDIPALVAPILEGRADVVVGDRNTNSVPHFSLGKKILQRFGSALVRFLSGTSVPDAVSGFRAFSREAAQRINVVSSFSYTIEMLVQCGNERMAIAHVPVGVNPKTRESRLFSTIPEFVQRSGATMLRTYLMYRPLKAFVLSGIVVLLVGVAPIGRFLYFFAIGEGDGHVQSLVLGSTLTSLGFIVVVVGLLADLVSVNRRLLAEALEGVRRVEGLLTDSGESASSRDV